jgi:hypothetical protein
VARPRTRREHGHPDPHAEPQNDHKPECDEHKADEGLQNPCAELDCGHVVVALVVQIAGVVIVIRVLDVRSAGVALRVDVRSMDVRTDRNAGVSVRVHVHVQAGQLSCKQTQTGQRKHWNPEVTHSWSIHMLLPIQERGGRDWEGSHRRMFFDGGLELQRNSLFSRKL